MIHSESESEIYFSFANDSVSDFDSVSESESESDLALMNLDICFFCHPVFTLFLINLRIVFFFIHCHNRINS